MYSNEPIEHRRVRSVVSSVGGRSSQRRSNAINANSRLFMTAVKDVSRSSRGTSDRSEEYMTKAQLAKRPYSPTSDFRIDDVRLQNKARKIDSDSVHDHHSYDPVDDYSNHHDNLERKHDRNNGRTTPDRTTNHHHNGNDRFTPERQMDDRVNVVRLTPDHPSPEVVYDTTPRHERGRYVNERHSSESQYSFPPQFSFEPREIAQPRSVLERLGKKGNLTTAYINPAFFQNQPTSSISDVNMMPPQNMNNILLGPKVARCRHWPNCDLGMSCRFHHPNEICRLFPNCPNSDRTCLYVHPANTDYNYHVPSSFGQQLSGQAQNTSGYASSRKGLNGRSNDESTRFEKEQEISETAHGNSVEDNAEIPADGLTTDETALGASTLVTEEPVVSLALPSNSSEVPPGPPAVLCKFGENCANSNCLYAHASPASFGTGTAPTSLLALPCKFKVECTNPKCRFSHPSPAICLYLYEDYGGKVQTPCRNGANCTRPDCYFLHPWDKLNSFNIPCKFDILCRRPDCRFLHPNGKAKSEFNTTIPEHSITVDEDEEEEQFTAAPNQLDNSTTEESKESNGEKSESDVVKVDEPTDTLETNVDDYQWDDLDVIINSDPDLNGNIGEIGDILLEDN